MSIETPEDNEYREVDDAEGYVDRKHKERILTKRRQVDDWKQQLFTSYRTGDAEKADVLALWRDRIVDYLVAIEPLLRDESLPNAEYVYLGVPLGEITLQVPEEYNQDESGRTTINDVREKDFEFVDAPPESKTVTVTGLKDVIELEQVNAEWQFTIRRFDGVGLPFEEVQVEETGGLTKSVLQNAVRVADEWLQNAGVGLSMKADNHGKT